MILLRYLLVFGGIMLLAGAVAILIMDVYQILKFRKDSSGDPPRPPRWHAATDDWSVRCSAPAPGSEHRGGAQRIGGRARQPVRRNPAGDAVSGRSLDRSAGGGDRAL